MQHLAPLDHAKQDAAGRAREGYVPGILVIWRKSGGVRGFGDFAALNFLKSVEALAGGGEGVHEMHAGRLLGVRVG